MNWLRTLLNRKMQEELIEKFEIAENELFTRPVVIERPTKELEVEFNWKALIPENQANAIVLSNRIDLEPIHSFIKNSLLENGSEILCFSRYLDKDGLRLEYHLLNPEIRSSAMKELVQQLTEIGLDVKLLKKKDSSKSKLVCIFRENGQHRLRNPQFYEVIP